MIARLDRCVAARALVALLLCAPARNAAAEDAVALRLDLGIMLAIAGQAAEAESVFISALTLSPHDPRALNNIGNTKLLRGDAELAAAFYARAAREDTTDAGILLNRAVALLLQGEDAGARLEARRAIRLTGGAAQARSLLGIREGHAGPSGDRGSGQPAIVPQEIAALLEAVEAAVPIDSTAAAAADSDAVTGEAAPPRKAPAWRSAGPRAAERVEIAATLYWKR